MSYVVCPNCGRSVDWAAAEPVSIGDGGEPVPLRRDPRETDDSWNERLQTAYRTCSGLGRPDSHLLPYDYDRYRHVVIGMVGSSDAGKSTLLAAMIHRLCSGDPAFARLGLQVEPLDLASHRRYVTSTVDRLMRRQRLSNTRANKQIVFRTVLKVTNREGGAFAVSFFDVAGEQLARSDPDVRFYATADALIFVVDSARLPRPGRPQPTGESTFEEALRRLSGRASVSSTFIPVPAAVVVAKADLIRFDDPLVGYWLAKGSADEETELSTVEEESADVYTYLTLRGATAWLAPASRCYKSTLHFASATNGSPTGDTYDGAFRQVRVLKPLLSVFAMTGILDERLLEPDSEQV